MNHFAPIFKKSQIVWALYRVMTYASLGCPKEIPRKFEYRIKRLLDLDAAEGGEAFYELPRQGKGHDTLFSMFDAFCLGIGLYLSDMTIHQKHIVYLMRHIRHDLKKEFKWIIQSPPPLDRQNYAHGEDSLRPYFKNKNNHKYVDYTSYLTFRQIVFMELYPALEGELENKKPLFTNVNYYHGASAMHSVFNESFPNHHKDIMIIETGHIAGGLYKNLPDAPELKRGR